MLYVGNDVVDPAVAGCKSENNRFVQRVFTEYEQRLIRDASRPEHLLWCLWAGKETAFKIISKITGPPVFAHRKFVHHLFDFSVQDDGEITAQGQITYDEYRIAVRYLARADVIHAAGGMFGEHLQGDAGIFSDFGQTEPLSEEKHQTFSAEELASIRFPAAADVRIRCKRAIARATGIDIERLQIIRPRQPHAANPPFLLVDGERSEIDISLAHHGQWIAWVYSIPA